MTNWENLENVKEQDQATSQDQGKSKMEFKDLKDVKEGRGLKIGLYGDFATGKTHFALTAPTPIFIIDTENGVIPLAHNFKDKDIKILDVAEEDGVKSYEKVAEAVDFITKQESVGTVIIDSISDLWDYCQEYGKVRIFNLKPEQRFAQQWDWGIINKLYLGLLLKLIRKDYNLIVTSREGEIYIGAGQPTDRVKPKWQKTTGFWVDYVLHMNKRLDKFGKLSFVSEIEKSRSVGELIGKKFDNLTFDRLLEEINKLKKM